MLRNNIYMVNGVRKQRQSFEAARVFSPYVIIAALVVFLLWHERTSSSVPPDVEDKDVKANKDAQGIECLGDVHNCIFLFFQLNC